MNQFCRKLRQPFKLLLGKPVPGGNILPSPGPH
jgi:hypothetical protein